MTTHQAVLDILPDHVDGLRDFKIADAIRCRIRGLAAGSVAVQVRFAAGASVRCLQRYRSSRCRGHRSATTEQRGRDAISASTVRPIR